MPQPNFSKIGYFDEQNQFVPLSIPAQNVVDSTGVTTEAHMANAAIHLTAEQAALIAGSLQSSQIGESSGIVPLGADGKIPAKYYEQGCRIYSFIQSEPASTWEIQHNLQLTPVNVLIRHSSGEQIVGFIDYSVSTLNLLIIRFSEAVTGTAIFNY